MQTSHGNLVLKCYRLSEECIKVKEKGINSFIHPKNIFEEISVTITNPALVRALLTDIADGVHGSGENGLYDAQAETTFQRLDLSTNPYLEKHLEFLASWVDDLAAEQQKFQYYTRQLARGGGKDSRKDWKKKREEDLNEDGDGWGSSDAPRRMESLLISNQIRSYCDQMDKFTSGGLSKLYLAGGLHKDNK
jgi:translation initiation factor 3 subunit H